MTADQSVAPAPASSRAGLVATVVLCVVLVAYTLLLSVDGFFIGFVSDSCGENGCNSGLLETAVLLGGFGPAVVSLIAIVVSIVRLVRQRRLTWLFPIGAGLLGTIIFYGAVALGYASAGQAFVP